jgi:general stress protein 26
MITFFKDEQQDILEANNLIRQQIVALGSALFFTENESLLKLPVHVINNVQVNDEHEIWFVIQRPTQALSEFDAQLPAKLDFFKKGMPYQVKVKGIASIVDDAAKVSALAGDNNSNGLVAVKVVIQSTEYIQTVTTKPAQNWIQQGKQQLSSLFS